MSTPAQRADAGSAEGARAPAAGEEGAATSASRASAAASGAGAAHEDEPRRGWVVVGAAFTALAVIFGISYSFAAFFEPFAAEFGAARADISLVFGITGLVYFTLGAVGGMLADRFGPRVVVGSGMACVVLSLVAGSRAGSMAQVIVAYGVVLGVGIALVYTPAIGCVPPWFTRRRGLAAGLASAGIGAGTLLVPLAATAAIAAWQWRGGMLALAAFAAVAGGAAAWLLARAPSPSESSLRAQAHANPPRGAGAGAGAGAPAAGAGVPAAGGGATLREALATPRFRWLYAMCVLGAPSMFVPFAHLSASARDLGVAPAQAVGLVGLIGIGSLTGRFAVGAMADRIGRPLALVWMEASLGASMLLWLLVPAWPGAAYAVLAVFALWMGLSYGGCVSLMPALCMDFFGARAVSSIIGTLYTGAAFGNLAGPWLAGWAFDQSGSYVPVIAACTLLSVLATWAASRAVRPG